MSTMSTKTRCPRCSPFSPFPTKPVFPKQPPCPPCPPVSHVHHVLHVLHVHHVHHAYHVYHVSRYVHYPRAYETVHSMMYKVVPQRGKKSRANIFHCKPPNIGAKITVLTRAFKRYVIFDVVKLDAQCLVSFCNTIQMS